MAARINELKQSLIEARAAHAALLETHLKAAGDTRGFTDDEKLAQSAAETLVSSLTELAAAEQKRLDLATPLLTNPTSVQVSAPNHVEDPRRGFRSHREFLLSVISNAGLRDRSQVTDERLRPLAVMDKDDKQAAGDLAYLQPLAWTPAGLRATVGSDEQGVYDDRYGGIGVQKVLLPGMLSVAMEGDPTAGRTQMVPMSVPSVGILARTDKNHTSSVSGGLTVARRAETVAAAASRMSMEEITLKASSLFGLSYVTEELLADSPQSFVAILESGFRDQFGAYMLGEKLRGLGGSEYLGVLTALAASSLGPTISIAKETAQTAATIVANNVIKMAARIWGFDNAIWIANHDTKPHLYILSIPIGVGGVAIFQPSREVGFPDMLLGRPVYYSEYASTVGTQGDIGLYNFSQYLEGLYQPLQSAESIHVRFVNHERTFKFWLRNAGAPWWRSALTPAKSTATLSPFVVLDARA